MSTLARHNSGRTPLFHNTPVAVIAYSNYSRPPPNLSPELKSPYSACPPPPRTQVRRNFKLKISPPVKGIVFCVDKINLTDQRTLPNSRRDVRISPETTDATIVQFPTAPNDRDSTIA